MKAVDLALEHNIPVDEFNHFIEKVAFFPIKKNLFGDITIPDNVDTENLLLRFWEAKGKQADEDLLKKKEERDRQEKLRYEHEEFERKQREEQYHLRLSKLKEQNHDGYYEYKVVSLLDNGGLFKSNSGRVNVVEMTQALNELGLDGWHLVTAYSNELGKNALSGGAGGALLGINSTVDENILIFERFVKIT